LFGWGIDSELVFVDVAVWDDSPIEMFISPGGVHDGSLDVSAMLAPPGDDECRVL
jgi:hypothetical protein